MLGCFLYVDAYECMTALYWCWKCNVIFFPESTSGARWVWDRVRLMKSNWCYSCGSACACNLHLMVDWGNWLILGTHWLIRAKKWLNKWCPVFALFFCFSLEGIQVDIAMWLSTYLCGAVIRNVLIAGIFQREILLTGKASDWYKATGKITGLSKQFIE